MIAVLVGSGRDRTFLSERSRRIVLSNVRLVKKVPIRAPPLTQRPHRTNTRPRVTDGHDPGYRVERVELQDGRTELRFVGQLRFRQCYASWHRVRQLSQPP